MRQSAKKTTPASVVESMLHFSHESKCPIFKCGERFGKCEHGIYPAFQKLGADFLTAMIEHRGITLWVCGKMSADQSRVFFEGVFTSEARAIAACKSSHYWIGPLTLDQEYPDDAAEWPGAYFPLAENPDRTPIFESSK